MPVSCRQLLNYDGSAPIHAFSFVAGHVRACCPTAPVAMETVWLTACCAAVAVYGVLWAVGGRFLGYRVPAGSRSSTRAAAGTDPARSRSQGAVSLRVLSQNVWAHYIVPAPGRMRRLATLARHIREAQPPYDVVMVQVSRHARTGAGAKALAGAPRSGCTPARGAVACCRLRCLWPGAVEQHTCSSWQLRFPWLTTLPAAPHAGVGAQELFVMRLGLCVWSRELEFFAREMRALGLVYVTTALGGVVGALGGVVGGAWRCSRQNVAARWREPLAVHADATASGW